MPIVNNKKFPYTKKGKEKAAAAKKKAAGKKKTVGKKMMKKGKR